jgi:hypothetical protein
LLAGGEDRADLSEEERQVERAAIRQQHKSARLSRSHHVWHAG